jgi:hypothetical protein
VLSASCSLFLSLSFTPVTVTVCGVFQLLSVKVNDGVTVAYSTWGAFAAVKADGSITAWGDSKRGGSDAPAGTGYTKIYST